ncbi:MAG TPA: serine hydroxymethyltransferase [Actinocrinis sp.]|nr:serine hydroxymethyltransferase [Actinocrinis sp.]
MSPVAAPRSTSADPIAPFFGPDYGALVRTDPQIAGVLLDELDRQRGTLQLIASENPASPAVLAALGSVLSNKYAEGYPGRRYYGGCAQVDTAERLGVARACALFGADHANIQPHTGAAANLAVFAALLTPGDRVLAMALQHGGHLTHGAQGNFSGTWFETLGYPVSEDTELIDYDRVRDLARSHRPKLIICGATAYSRLIDFAAFRSIADEVGAYLLVDAAHFAGLVAGRAIPSPVPYADVVTLTTHKTLRGPRGGAILCRAELASAIDRAVFPFSQGGPLMHAVAAKAVAFAEASRPEFRAYATQVVSNARALTAALAQEGMRPVSGGTDTHLAVLDLRGSAGVAVRTADGVKVTGREAELRCEHAGIMLNRSCVPYDSAKPMVTSGLRVGTATVTTQGMKEPEMYRIAALVGRAVRDADGSIAAQVQKEVAELVDEFPLYQA